MILNLTLLMIPLMSSALVNAEATEPDGAPLVAKPDGSGGDVAGLYTQTGSDPSFQSLLDGGTIPVGQNSNNGVQGSKITVNKALLKQLVESNHPIPQNIGIHTLCNSVNQRKDFPKWTRWYQEDGDTQVFRLFKGEHNVRNSRPDAGRVEAFSMLSWERGYWHEWEGTYTIVKPHPCAIFQVMNSKNAWAVHIDMNDEGDVILNHRRGQKHKIIAEKMTGKSFHLKVRDNGHNYEVYLNGNKVGEGYYERPEGKTNFRWGMYDKTLKHDAMIFVTGARFK